MANKAEADASRGAGGGGESADDDAAFEPLIVAEQVGSLFSTQRLPYLISVANAAILMLALGPDSPLWLRAGWWSAIVALAVSRLVLVRAYRRRPTTPGEATRWARFFCIGIGLNGAIWGAAPLLFPAPGRVALHLLMTFVLGGMVAGATATASSYPLAFRAFVVPALTPLVVTMALAGDRVNLAMASMMTLYGVSMSILSGRTARAFVREVRLRLRNERLVLRLAEARDLLERRVLERTAELRATLEEQRLAESKALQAVAARDDFLAVASHELLTPLSALQLSVRVMEQDVTLGRNQTAEHRAAGLVALNRQVLRMTALVDTVFRVSGLDRGQLILDERPIELCATVQAAVSDLEISGETGMPACPLNLRLAGAIHGTWDPTRVEQIVVNLVSNALKYGAGKPVDVELAADPQDAARVLLLVSDRGCGIAPHELGSIFEKFRRGEAGRRGRGPGLGLGLFVVRELVRAMGGEVSVTSTLGAGSTFRVSLPGRTPDAAKSGLQGPD